MKLYTHVRMCTQIVSYTLFTHVSLFSATCCLCESELKVVMFILAIATYAHTCY